ncbi:hypothetical protein N9J66_05295 [Gammaproteobacteria bacterium]|jgi:hypothetical protein|nr:hypothetical protein [Gammaproteobacteria bacterium]
MKDNYFYQTDHIPSIDIEHMENVLENPPLLCGCNECPQDIEGNYCKCILDVFPHESHYKHYLELVKLKAESLIVDLILKDK